MTLAQRIKSKYPQYAQVPDAELEKRVVARYPQYARLSSSSAKDKKTFGGFLGNVGKSGANLVSDLGTAILNPIDTAKGVVGLGSSVISNILPGEQGNEQLAREVGEFYKDRYGSLDKAYETFYNDPVGMLADASTVLGGAGVVAKGARLGKIGSALSKVSRATDPMRVPGRVVGAGRAGASRLGIKAPNMRGNLASAMASESENILTRGMGNPRQLEKARGVSPVPMSELFDKYKLYDRAPETFGDAARSANKTGRQMLKDAPTQIDTRRIVKLFDDEIAKLSKEARTSSKAQLAMQELMNRKQMYLEGIQNSDISTPLGVDATRAYDIKSNFQGDMPPSSFGMPTSEIGKNLGTKRAYQTLLSGIEEQAPGIKNIGREQSALRRLEDIAKASESRGAARQNLNFTKMGGAGLAGMAAGVPGIVGGFVAERVANSPQFLGAASRGLGAGSRAIQSGAKVPQAVGNAYNKIPTPIRQGARKAPGALYGAARAGRMVPQQQPAVVPQSNKPMAEKKQDKKPRFTVDQFKQPKKKNVFSNNAAFGGTFSVKRGNFS